MVANPRRVLNKQIVEPHYEQLSIKDLRFDVDNQRLQHLVRAKLKGRAATQQDCLDLIWDLPDTKELHADIRENGGLRTPLSATADRVVVEGNRRLACLKKLNQQHPTNEIWASVSTEVFPENTPLTLIREFLFAEHVAGRKDWDAFEQAEYVYRLHHEDGKSYEWLATNGHVSKSKVKQQFLAYELMSEFLERHADADIRKFNYFLEMVKKPPIRRRLEVESEQYSKDFVDEMFFLVANKKLSDAKQVRNLAEIYENPRASALLKRSGYQAALAYLDELDPTRRSDTWSDIQRATNAISAVGIDEISDIAGKNDDSRVALLRDLVESIRKFERVVKVKVLN